MPVQQHVLNWLYSVLTSEYHDVNRTYNDVAQAITRFSSLAPRTDVHTFPNGSSALLLHLSGTVPVNFRGNTYRFPVSIWMPHAYPREPPLIYVTPTETMVIRPGQHVDPQGQVYHPYLVGWAQYWDKSSLQDFLTILAEVFAKEPPVVARQQSRQVPSPQGIQSPPPPGSRQHAGAPPQGQHQQQAPPPPPKTAHGDDRGQSTPSSSRDSGPPLPPLPAHSPETSRRASRYDSAPPLPPEARGGGHDGSPASSRPSPYTQVHPQGHGQHPPQPHHPAYVHGAPGGVAGTPSQSHHPSNQEPSRFQQNPPPHQNPVQGQWHPHGLQPYPHPPNARWNETRHPPQPRSAPAPPPPDLLDEPLTLDLPAQSSIAPPPIPPNPEKDALLRQLAQTLASMRQQSRQQNESSMSGLQAQRNAMLSVIPALQSEMGQLTQLSNVLASNTTILHDALRKADGVIEGSKSHPAPDIDELLVAPTVVANQLYTLVAEERALGDAIFMLGRAVERGRISPTVFAKMTRSLAREWYLKKALVRKIGLGMGLAAP